MAMLQRQTGLGLSRVLFGSPALSSPARPALPLLSTLTLPSISIQIPGFLSDIWEGVLRAVPKKKTSHMKKRHRQLAGKALKDVKSINTCPGCGRPKKAHFLCPYCVAEIKQSYLDKWMNKIPADK
ncbi:Ski complex subunit Rec14 [Knufia obscura]|uniref:Large ribosomal subunit protein bL32m n=2 Tax=Knufia TaxID=430999 RepID=A0AAN8EHW9_9EURO|nr:Ski complex subunit Rec14 [Knufia obscura]KAK5955938.1 Ski complex subunit Rec14 [Knufia fluminis]